MSAADIKLVLLGHKNVGKTSLFNRYVYDEFGKTTMTIGAYFGMKHVKVKERIINLAIWDTAGEEKFDALTNFYCRSARAALVCYDITNEDSFTGIQRWVDKVIQEAEKDCAMLIVGNKLDVVEDNPERRKVSFQRAQEYAKSVNAVVVEASAKSGIGVNEAFQQVVMTCYEQGVAARGEEEAKNAGNVKLNPGNGKEKKGCC